MMNVSPREAVFLLGALTQIDQYQVRRDAGSRRDPLAVLRGIRSGRIKYRLADPNEHWQTRKEILEHGYGDCEDFASAIAAELNETVYAAPEFGLAQALQSPPPLPRPPGPVTDPWVAWGACGPSFGAVPERAVPVAYRARSNLFHVVVWAPGFGYLDPSVAGGMGSDYGASGQERARWLRSIKGDSPRAWRVAA